jgi:hypothetical protein
VCGNAREVDCTRFTQNRSHSYDFQLEIAYIDFYIEYLLCIISPVALVKVITYY